MILVLFSLFKIGEFIACLCADAGEIHGLMPLSGNRAWNLVYTWRTGSRKNAENASFKTVRRAGYVHVPIGGGDSGGSIRDPVGV